MRLVEVALQAQLAFSAECRITCLFLGRRISSWFVLMSAMHASLHHARLLLPVVLYLLRYGLTSKDKKRKRTRPNKTRRLASFNRNIKQNENVTVFRHVFDLATLVFGKGPKSTGWYFCILKASKLTPRGVTTCPTMSAYMSSISQSEILLSLSSLRGPICQELLGNR